MPEEKTAQDYIIDYWNAWFITSIGQDRADRKNDLGELLKYPAKTFEEYVKDKEENLGRSYDMSLVPKQFLFQNNRLVRIYNSMIKKDSIDFTKLDRVRSIAHALIYDKKY